ncbi:E3 ubiquitin-protein ligase BRE1A-like [Temnothorax curvispinosus]|uniref:E3 ubiquitin-protein ligase BRE1A-like n=1 Tax=Temnothorax curvispinosus TaxID=300111 RepID=A0A6J1RER4_9HYME|nr:E3 ubiquitin-protein ligase BRE1A-like [Temnothorax curvispinosus]
MSKEVQGTDKKRTARELKGRERADSLSILDYVRGGDKEKEKEHNKRKQEERERLADKIFKKSNMMNRTLSGLKQTGEEREITNEEGTLMGMLRELKIEMVGLRNEIKEIKENWKLRVDRIEKKLMEMEERMKEMERRRGEARVAKVNAQERVLEFRIGDRVDSDYLPLTLLPEKEENTRQIEGWTEEEKEEQNMSKKIICGTEIEVRNEAMEVRDMGTEEINKKQVQDTERELQEEEIVRAVRNMKLGKTAGVDEIPMEAWRYGGAAIRRSLTDLLKLIWKEVQREREKDMAIGKDKIFAIFVDLKAAFDNVDRGILLKTMEEKGVERSLINKIKEIYKKDEGDNKDEEWVHKVLRRKV